MIDSVILSRFDGQDILLECVVVCIRGAYKLVSHWTNWTGGRGAKTLISFIILLFCVGTNFGGWGSFGCHWWKLSSVLSYELRMSDKKNQDVLEIGLSNCSVRYLNLHPIFCTSKILLIFKGFSPVSVSWGSIAGWAILRCPAYWVGSEYCLRRLMLKTGCNLEKEGGSSRWYAFFPTLWSTLKGPIYWKSNFPDGWVLWILWCKTIMNSPGLNTGTCVHFES